MMMMKEVSIDSKGKYGNVIYSSFFYFLLFTFLKMTEGLGAMGRRRRRGVEKNVGCKTEREKKNPPRDV